MVREVGDRLIPTAEIAFDFFGKTLLNKDVGWGMAVEIETAERAAFEAFDIERQQVDMLYSCII